MAKKQVGSRQRGLKKTSKKKGVLFYLSRYFISVISIFFIVGFVSFFLKNSASSVCANSISCVNDLSVRVENDVSGIFEGHKVLPPKIFPENDKIDSRVLGLATQPGKKHIYVDLTRQTLYAYQGNKLIMKTLISSGKWFATPAGNYTVWIKLRATRMTGGSGDDYYDLPNVPYTMFFYNKDIPKSRGFSLHGAYWHNNFGYPMSHGCVNMRIVDAKALYEWIDPTTTGNETHATDKNPGTEVTIYGKAPEN